MGNVNSTYLVTLEGEGAGRLVLQRLNTQVFRKPELVMANIQRVSEHLARSPEAAAAGWRMPQLIPDQTGERCWVRDEQGGFWRLMTFLENCHCPQTITSLAQAREVARGLATFHALIADLPVEQLADTLEGFHVTPGYLATFRQVHGAKTGPLKPREEQAVAFVEARAAWSSVLEDARLQGLLQERPIHGDPKVNNVLLCAESGRAVALIDLDTVKPGLLHYDIGDCLRSACNPLGEETNDLDGVHFDLERAEVMLEAYLTPLRQVLSKADRHFLYDAIRLIPYELGLRFLTDHLAGNRYFRADQPGHNLDRALVQFRLTASIEAQETAIRALLERLA